MDKQQLIDKMVTEAMDNFDFQRVYDVMHHLDWEWDFGEQRLAVPSVYHLIKRAEELLRDVAQHIGEVDYYSVSSAGFMAVLDGDELSLRFVLTESSSFVSDFNSEEYESSTTNT